MSEIRIRTFGHTAAALVVHESGAAARAHAWASAETAADVDAAEAADADALRLVQLAYHKDTCDINSRGNCLRTDLAFMRKMAQGSAPIAAGDGPVLDDVAEDDGDAYAYAADAPGPR
jgi:hypothetical protein